MPYFRRPGHVGLLVGVSLFTQGIGGLVYWLARRRHRICPRCGLGWERAYPLGGLGMSYASQGGQRQPDAVAPLPSGGMKWQVLGTLLVLFGCFFVLMGFVEFEAGMVVAGSAIGALGTGSVYLGWKAKQDRRQAILGGLQQHVLRLATRHGGTLTVTEVAAELNLSMQAAEKVLVSMDDGFRVRSDVTEEGIVVFEFPEVLHRPRLEPGSGQG